MTDTLFQVAGFSISPDGIKFHVSRDTNVKAININMGGETYFRFVVLPSKMTKPQAAKHLLDTLDKAKVSEKVFAVLQKVVSGPVVPEKAPKAPKAPKVVVAKPVKPVKGVKSNAAATLKAAVAPADAAAKAKRLETIRAIAAKRNK
jgi:hypothetical protein